MTENKTKNKFMLLAHSLLTCLQFDLIDTDLVSYPDFSAYWQSQNLFSIHQKWKDLVDFVMHQLCKVDVI